MSLVNGSFEDGGAHDGLAAGWHRRGRRTTQFVLAGFGTRDAGVLKIQNPLAFSAGLHWVLAGTAVSPDATAGPDNGGLADTLLEAGGLSGHSIYAAQSRAFAGGSAYSFGVHAMPAGRDYCALGFATGTGAPFYVLVRLSTAEIVAYPETLDEVELANAHVLVERDGWVRIELAFLMGADLSTTPSIIISADGTLADYAGDPSKGLHLWGAYISAGGRRGAEEHALGWSLSEDASAAITTSVHAQFATELADPTAKSTESHESGWVNSPLHVFGDHTQAAFDAAVPEAVEDHEEEWAASQAAPTAIQASVLAAFDGDGLEDHEDGWLGNQGASTSIASSVLAAFDGASPEAHEDHEEAFADVEYALDATAGEFQAVAHGLANGTSFYVYAQYGGFIPDGDGVNESVRLYVVNATADTFQAALSPGGASVAWGDDGTGRQFVTADPARYWGGAHV
jgi:hypothetical protein